MKRVDCLQKSTALIALTDCVRYCHYSKQTFYMILTAFRTVKHSSISSYNNNQRHKSITVPVYAVCFVCQHSTWCVEALKVQLLILKKIFTISSKQINSRSTRASVFNNIMTWAVTCGKLCTLKLLTQFKFLARAQVQVRGSYKFSECVAIESNATLVSLAEQRR